VDPNLGFGPLEARAAPEGMPRLEEQRVWALDGKTPSRRRRPAPTTDGEVASYQSHLVSVLDRRSSVVPGRTHSATTPATPTDRWSPTRSRGGDVVET
jgi:hypothetical protein